MGKVAYLSKRQVPYPLVIILRRVSRTHPLYNTYAPTLEKIMKHFYIFHYGYHRDLWKHTLVQARDEESARKAFRKISHDHIISVLASRF